MKLELTNPKAWKKISERKIPMESKIKIYEKIGGAYRLGLDEGEQVYNKLSELLKSILKKEGDFSYSYKKSKKSVNVDAPTYDEDISQSYDVDEPVGKANIPTNFKVKGVKAESKAKIRKEADADVKVSSSDVGEPDPKSFKPSAASFKVSESNSSGDHEVGMAMGQLDDIIKNATELKGKIGTQEMNMPGWIQDHISQSQNFINQANTGYHKLDDK